MTSPRPSTVLIEQISRNLANTRASFGPNSPQYRAVLDVLRECIAEAESSRSTEMVAPESSRSVARTIDAEIQVDQLRVLLERELKIVEQ
ncbi:uncharacterized protein CIMG_12967 [Coccidioides immitis RS]|uniref:Uncharacterized protein n=1 Tax=Coccidioides immitis (strain RS) TaxID=246410 RepID=A0A0D8JSV5_COCIM|nr:uncharacterized protein CIMG_12967 [Coccidioides immitis RS]KJF60430.1 hypothetical protein CIMG_12967 [Coccidioides immitis RS]